MSVCIVDRLSKNNEAHAVLQYLLEAMWTMTMTGQGAFMIAHLYQASSKIALIIAILNCRWCHWCRSACDPIAKAAVPRAAE